MVRHKVPSPLPFFPNRGKTKKFSCKKVVQFRLLAPPFFLLLHQGSGSAPAIILISSHWSNKCRNFFTSICILNNPDGLPLEPVFFSRQFCVRCPWFTLITFFSLVDGSCPQPPPPPDRILRWELVDSFLLDCAAEFFVCVGLLSLVPLEDAVDKENLIWIINGTSTDVTQTN